MPEAILYVISGFFALIFVVRSIIDATTKINIQINDKNQQANIAAETNLSLAQMNTVLNTTLQDFRSELREIKAQTASQQTLEHLAKYLVEMRRELSVLTEMSTLSKVNTGRIASIERHVIALHTIVVSDTPNQNMIPFPFAIPGMGSGPMGSGGPMGWKPLGIKREDGKYKTEDGEHEADSLEELLAKLSGDSQYRIDPNFKQVSSDDIDEMKKMFEGELEEDDDDKEDWQKDGKNGEK